MIFANRSAALHHMGRYELCLRDTNRALELGYPPELEYKLRERQARCHMANKDPYEAMEAFKLTLKALDRSKLPLEKRLKMERECETMVQLFIRNKEQPRVTTTTAAATAKKPKFQQHDALSFDHDTQNGRYAKASARINVGATIVVEKPHCSMLLAKYKQSHCHHCYKRTFAPLPCPDCQDAVFCGEPCREAALRHYHRTECKLLKTLNESGLSIICLLALRMLSQKSVEYFEAFLRETGAGDDEAVQLDMDTRLS